mmetsp:Transcript_26809/g.43776  ORF Transcript_26809/g.43776 Transcript_26809/m.43776 type:complete len:330 (-) Transcript_26809:738-1727(-)
MAASSGKYMPVALSKPLWHLFNWVLAAAIFVGCEVGFTQINPPMRRFGCADPIIGQPLSKETVPYGILVALCCIVPLVVFVVYAFFVRQPTTRHPKGESVFWWPAYSIYYPYLIGLAATVLITELIKPLAGSLRPDFLDRCQLPGVCNVNQLHDISECTGNSSDILEGRKSFPSGHTSTSVYSGVFMSLFIYLVLFRVAKMRNGLVVPFTLHSWRAIVILIPSVVAVFIASSRLFDSRHRIVDVLVGGLLGTAMAFAFFFGFASNYTAFFIPSLEAREQDADLQSAPLNPQASVPIDMPSGTAISRTTSSARSEGRATPTHISGRGVVA